MGPWLTRKSLLPALILMAAHEPASADDWPQWRGPSGQGTTTAKNLPPVQGTSSLTLRWKTPLPGEGCSSPVVSQGRVYVTAAYQGEERHPWDWAAAMGMIVLAGCVAGLALLRFPAAIRALTIPPSPAPGLVGLAALTVAVIAVVTVILAKPQWFWQFSDPWSGTVTAAAELSFVETLFLRPVIVLLAGSLVLVFARLARRVQPVSPLGEEATTAPLIARWMALVTVCCTLACAFATGLIAWRPEWFWHPGQPWLAWMVSSGLTLTALAAAVGWLGEAAPTRRELVALGLVLAGWLFYNTPPDEFTALFDLRLRLSFVVPAAVLLVGHGSIFVLAFGRNWPRTAASSRLLPLLLLVLGLAFFMRSNYLRPQVGLVRAVLCVDAKSGAMLWNTPAFVAAAEKAHTFNSHATPTPAADGDHVYAYFGSGLAALDKDGRVLWLKRDDDYHRYSRYGSGSSIALAGDLLIVYQDSEYMGHGHHLDDDADQQVGRRPSVLIAYDKKTGEERWRIAPGFSHDSYMTPLVWSHEGRLEVVIATWKTLAGFSARDGAQLWTFEYPMQQIVPSLAVHGDCLFVTGGNNLPCPIYALRPPTREQPGQTVWSHQKGGGNMVSPVCWDGLLFAISHNGVLACREADTGELQWSKRLGGRYLGSIVAGDGKLYAVDQEGTLFIVAATRQGGVLAEYPFRENCAATPALGDGCIYVRTAGHLWCIGGAP